MDILRQIAVVLGAVAFLAVCWWAFSPKRRKRFEEDAKLPFADEELSRRSAEAADDDKDTDENSGAGDRRGSGTPPADKNKGQDEQ